MTAEENFIAYGLPPWQAKQAALIVKRRKQGMQGHLVEMVKSDVELAWNPMQLRWPKGSGKKSGEWKDDGVPNVADAWGLLDKLRGKKTLSTPASTTNRRSSTVKRKPAAPRTPATPKAKPLADQLKELDRSQAKDYSRAVKLATKEARAKGKAPTKAQIGKHLPAGHPMKPVRAPRKPKAEAPIPTAPAPKPPPKTWEDMLRTPPKSPPGSSSGQPHGLPVSSALNPDLNEREHNAVQHAMRAIDKVHGDGALDRIMVNHKLIDAKRSDGTPVKGDNSWGQMVAYENTPKRSWIAMAKGKPDPAFTFTHEVGHFLDFQALGARRRPKNDDEKLFHDAYGDPVMMWGTDMQGPEMRRVQKELSDSVAILMLRRANREPKWKPYTDYLLHPHEQWARAYAQYIAVRSKDPLLLEGLSDQSGSDLIPLQWRDDDFEPIAEAIDAMFKKKGWIK